MSRSGGRCAFLTAAGLDGYVTDDHLAREPLGRRGWTLDQVAWTSPGAPWSEFDVVVVRSTWDYHLQLPRFLEVLEGIRRAGPRLANPLDLMRWNVRKDYLLDLGARGVRVITTELRRGLTPGSLGELARELDAPELVVKPLVGASGHQVVRVDAGDPEARGRVESAFRGRDVLVQPFQPSVLSEGEVSLVFLGGRLSHALRKRPARGEFRSQEERGAALEPLEPGEDLRELGRRALSVLDAPTLYARLDAVRDRAGSWAVMELELVEPSLYLRMDPGAPGRLADAVVEWTSGGETRVDPGS